MSSVLVKIPSWIVSNLFLCTKERKMAWIKWSELYHKQDQKKTHPRWTSKFFPRNHKKVRWNLPDKQDEWTKIQGQNSERDSLTSKAKRGSGAGGRVVKQRAIQRHILPGNELDHFLAHHAAHESRHGVDLACSETRHLRRKRLHHRIRGQRPKFLRYSRRLQKSHSVRLETRRVHSHGFIAHARKKTGFAVECVNGSQENVPRKKPVLMASRRGQIFLAVFLSDARCAPCDLPLFQLSYRVNSGTLLCTAFSLNFLWNSHWNIYSFIQQKGLWKKKFFYSIKICFFSEFHFILTLHNQIIYL